MGKNKKQRRVMFLLILILGITIGFALLSTTLNITGTAGIKKNTWDIHWDEESIQVTENSVQAETPTVTEEGQKVSYAVTLELPGDFYEFTIDAVNAGTVDGMVNIDGLTPTIKNKTTGEVTTLPSYIKYSVTYADGSPIEEFHKLAKRVDENTPTREKFKIRIEYDSQSSELPDDDKEFEIDDELPYIPDDGRGKDRAEEGILYYDGENYSNVKPNTELYVKISSNTSYVLTNGRDTGDVEYNTATECENATIEAANEARNQGVSEEDIQAYLASVYCIPNTASHVCMRKNSTDVCFEYSETLNWDCNYNSSTDSCDNTIGYTSSFKSRANDLGLNYCVIVPNTQTIESGTIVCSNKPVDKDHILDGFEEVDNTSLYQTNNGGNLFPNLILKYNNKSCGLTNYNDKLINYYCSVLNN